MSKQFITRDNIEEKYDMIREVPGFSKEVPNEDFASLRVISDLLFRSIAFYKNDDVVNDDVRIVLNHQSDIMLKAANYLVLSEKLEGYINEQI